MTRMIVEFIDDQGKHRAGYADVDETASPDARSSQIINQLQNRKTKVSRIQKYYRLPAGTRGKP